MRTLVLLAFIISVFQAAASSAKEGLALKGVVPGVTTRAEMRTWPKDRYLHVSCPLDAGSFLAGAETCKVGLHTLAGKNVVHAIIFFVDDTVMALQVRMASEDIGTVADELTKKYGKPNEFSQPVQNAFGARFQNEILIWKNGDVSLTTMSITKKLGEGDITIRSEKMDAARAKKLEGVPKPSEDL